MYLQRSALGQTAALGSYYDARSDNFISASILESTLPSDAIQATKIDSGDVKVLYDDALDKQSEVMGIGGGLGLSILSGLTPVKGSSVSLFARPENDVLFANLYHTITTYKETLNLGFAALKDHLTGIEISDENVTHIVVAIEWGARSVISARQSLKKSSEQNVAQNQFQSDFVTFLSAVENLNHAEDHAVNLDINTQPQNPMDVTAYSDILQDDGILMDDLQGAYEFLEIMPLNIKDENGGKGCPIMYSLLPIEILSLVLPVVTVSSFGKFVPPAADSLCRLQQLFSEFQACQRNLDDLEGTVLANERYLPGDILPLIQDRKQECGKSLEAMKSNLRQMLQAVRGGSDPGLLWKFISECQNGESSPEYLSNVGTPFRRSIDFISGAVSMGATYIGYNGLDLDEALRNYSHSDVHVFFFNPSSMTDDSSWQENHNLLLELLQSQDPANLIAIVDCDAVPISFDGVRIAHYQGGLESTSDLLGYRGFLADKCFAICNENSLETRNIQKPIQRRHVTVPCPGPKCTVAKIQEWLCPRCEAPVEFGYSDSFIYCDCGRSEYSNYNFKCNSDTHGPSYTPYDLEQFLRLLKDLHQDKYMNILVLGETGVGKSTFINALVNYLEFETLDDAIGAERLNYVIPCSFSTQIMDRDNPGQPIQERQIKIGARDDEKDGSTGDSATQRTTVYPVTFNMGDSTLTVRLIDTPGMGDTRGVDFDRQNMADILSTLSGYDELHGILILLKSNSARLTITFSYCIKELLTHLHHNAAKNMAFGFTNTRISNYTPGDTYGPLKTLLHQHPDIGLSLSTPTTYCFDSESFRYLAAVKEGVPLPNKVDFDRSWKHSRDESLRLLSHFKENPPHRVRNTMSLNGARQLIGELTKPIAEITQVIESSIAMTEDKMQELKDEKLTGEDLRTRLHVQKVQMTAIPLDKPRTVCANGSCVEVRDDGSGQNKLITDYKTHCHPVCYLSDVHADQIAHPGLIHCAAFNGRDRCLQCQHHWQEHLHILYELIPETVTAIDNTIQQKLLDHANDITLRETALTQHEQRISEYKQEREIIRNAAAKFGVFLRKYSLAPYNDALIAYLDFLIKEEQMKVQVGGDRKRLLSLTEERHKHTEAIKVITRNLTSNATWETVSEGAIDRLVQSLYHLNHFGATLQNLKEGISTAHQATYREIPYRVRRKRGNMIRKHKSVENSPSPRHHQPEQTLLVNKAPSKSLSSSLASAFRKFKM